MHDTPRERHLHFPGFEHEGKRITNPTASAGGAVSPSHYDFERWQTGGGCTAWGKRLPDGTEIMLTDLSGTSHELPEPGLPFAVGLHLSEEYEQLGIWTMAVGQAYDGENQPVNEQDDGPTAATPRPAAAADDTGSGPGC